jgi:hypothetical protein
MPANDILSFPQGMSALGQERPFSWCPLCANTGHRPCPLSSAARAKPDQSAPRTLPARNRATNSFVIAETEQEVLGLMIFDEQDIYNRHRTLLPNERRLKWRLAVSTRMRHVNVTSSAATTYRPGNMPA